MTNATVDRVRLDEFLRLSSPPEEPLVIIDALREWPAMQRWSPRYLGESCRGRKTTVMVSHSGTYRPGRNGGPADRDCQYGIPLVPFEQAVDWICQTEETRKFYIYQTAIPPNLRGDLRFATLRGLEGELGANLWFGSAATATVLHYDSSHNLLAQLYGAKDVTLFGSDQLDSLYPYPDDCAMPHVSCLDVDAVDEARFPLFKNAKRVVTPLEAGQVLFIPAYWWHYVAARDISIAVNHWWLPRLEECRGATAERALTLEYARDSWLRLRAVGELSVQRLIGAATELERREPKLAWLAAKAAVDELRRRPRRAGSQASTSPPHAPGLALPDNLSPCVAPRVQEAIALARSLLLERIS